LARAKELLLIYPRIRYPSGDVPLGILYLASAVREKLNIQPEIMDLGFIKNPFQEIQDRVRGNQYQWVGISAMITMAEPAKKIAQLIKSISPETKVILGGPHPTTLPEKCLNHNFDYLALGEAEQTICEIIEKPEPENIQGVWFKKNGEWIKNPLRPMIENLDALPFPAFDLIELNQYKRLWFQLDTIGRPVRGASIIASRGCPYQCSFCQPTLEKLFGKKLRKRSPGNIVAELVWLKERFQIEGFIFVDDTLMIDKAWCQELAKEIVQARLNLVFGANFRAELVEEDILERLKSAGLRKIYLGIESSSERIRNNVLNKKISNEEIQRAVGIAKKLGLKAQGYFMIGAPGETKKEVKATLAYARGLNLDDLTINLTTPLPGTFLYQKFRSEIAIPEDKFDYYRNYAFRAKELSQSWLRGAQFGGYLLFYLHPKRFWALFKMLFSKAFLPRTILKLKRVL